MLLLRAIWNETRRIVFFNGFWLSMGLMLIILLVSTVYEEEDGTAYTVFAFAFAYNKQEISKYGLFAQPLFSTMVRYILPMYGPLFASLAFAGSLCEERKYGMRKYILLREGKATYVCSKALSAIITSGLLFLISGMLFLTFLYWQYPLKSADDATSFQYWLEAQSVAADGKKIFLYTLFGEHAFCILQLTGLFLYGIFCGFIGYICTIFFSNTYLVVCIPFFLGYIYYSISQAIMARAIEGSVSWSYVNTMNAYVSPEGYMYYWKMPESFGVNMVCLIMLWVISIGIHMFQIYKATDCGGK